MGNIENAISADIELRVASLREVEPLCARYAHWHDELQEMLLDLDAEVQMLKSARLKPIKAAIRKVAAAHGDLKDAIDSSPQLWKKPRTRVFHGVQVGMQKGRVKITWADPARVVERIKALYQDDIGLLVKVFETPVKEILQKLPAADLKKLGVSVTDSADQVVIRMVDSEVERMINTLLKDGLGEAVEEEAA